MIRMLAKHAASRPTESARREWAAAGAHHISHDVRRTVLPFQDAAAASGRAVREVKPPFIAVSLALRFMELSILFWVRAQHL